MAGTVLLSGYFLKCTPFLKELRQRFFELELEHCTLIENPLTRLRRFHWYCIVECIRFELRMSVFNLFFVKKLTLPNVIRDGVRF